MADNFERQKSTRWVKADVPSYGDQWGDEYDNYDSYDAQIPEEEVETNVAEKHESVKPNLVLSIDRPRIASDDDDDSETGFSAPPSAISEPTGGSFSDVGAGEERREPHSESESDEDVSFMPESPDREYADHTLKDPSPEPQLPKWAGSVNIPSHNDASDNFVPPTPTFSQSTFTQNVPETPSSERSFLSDTDSIQREPESLHVGGRFNDNDLNEIQEDPALEKAAAREPEPKPEHEAPQAPSTLVLSVDRMNLHDSDSSDESDDSDSLDFRDSVAERATTKETLVVNPPSDSAPPETDKIDSPLHITKSSELPGTKRPIKTDALDSLIDDLQKMERSSIPDSSFSSNKGETKEELSSRTLEEETDNNLPSLGSIHDMSLPNFEDQSFDEYSGDTSNILGAANATSNEDVQKAHESYVSRISSRSYSVKKAPPKSPKLEPTEAEPIAPSTPKRNTSAGSELGIYDANNPLQIGLVPVLSPESISTKHLSADLTNLAAMRPPQPQALKEMPEDLSRRDSTMTTSTFNMGSWKPNTNMYRDQFVNDNDNESQMNMSVYDTKDNYDKFVGARSPAGYAESFTNSSTLSVPETVALPSIHEDVSDNGITHDDDTSDEHSFDHSKQSETQSMHSVPSVIKDHRSSGGSVFKEEKLTLPGSLEILQENQGSREKYRSVSSTDTKSSQEASAVPERTNSKRIGSTSSFGVSKPVKQKYPVSKWKELTSYSQPIDRIAAFKAAKQREIEYDTGLQYWLQETLGKTDDYSNMHVGKLAEEAFQNATHTDIRRHTSMAINTTSLRNKVSMVKDKMDTTAGFGRRFLNKGKKLMKS